MLKGIKACRRAHRGMWRNSLIADTEVGQRQPAISCGCSGGFPSESTCRCACCQQFGATREGSGGCPFGGFSHCFSFLSGRGVELVTTEGVTLRKWREKGVVASRLLRDAAPQPWIHCWERVHQAECKQVPGPSTSPPTGVKWNAGAAGMKDVLKAKHRSCTGPYLRSQ